MLIYRVHGWTRGRFEISTDRDRLNRSLIHSFLGGSYWAKDIPYETVKRSIENSVCFGAYYRGRQVGFARVVTDLATFAYVGDVFVVPEFQRQGIAHLLVQTALDHPDLQGFRRWILGTRDAHSIYFDLGFRPLARPSIFMEIHDPDVYRKG